MSGALLLIRLYRETLEHIREQLEKRKSVLTPTEAGVLAEVQYILDEAKRLLHAHDVEETMRMEAAKILGKKGGKARSPAKTEAARRNIGTRWQR